jgi:hypothetical protein
MHKYIALAIAMLLASTSSIAKDGVNDLAERFVALMRYDNLFSKYQLQCIATQRSVSPEALVDRNPNYFGAIRPGHAKWANLVEIYGKYFQQACARPTRQEFLQVLSSSYAKNLSAKQLQESIAFYSSGTGSALIEAHAQATATLYETWTSINSRYLADLTAKFQQEVSTLSAIK